MEEEMPGRSYAWDVHYPSPIGKPHTDSSPGTQYTTALHSTMTEEAYFLCTTQVDQRTRSAAIIREATVAARCLPASVPAQ